MGVCKCSSKRPNSIVYSIHSLVPSYPFTHVPIPPPPIFLQYMVQVLHAGDNMEFFIEGSRSRSGKPGIPKAGLLSVLVDSVKEGIHDH